MTKPVARFAALSCALLLGGTPASAITIDFTGAGTANYEVVSQTYGDSTAANLSYRTLLGGDNWGLLATIASDHADYWAQAQYSGDNAIFASADSHKLELRIDVGAGQELFNLQFNIGSYPNISRTAAYQIFDGSGNLLDSSAAFNASNLGSVLALASPVIGSVILQLGDSWNVGVTSISYDVRNPSPDAVPIPAALPLLASALGIAGFFGRKRKQSQSAAAD